MKITAKFKDILQDAKGNSILCLSISNFQHRHMIEALEDDKTYSVEIKEVKSKRSIEQNKFLWKLLHDIDVAMNGKPTDEMEIYIMCLERANAKFDYLGCLEEAEEMLKQNFRAVKRIKPIDLNGKDGYMYKCFIGSSKMNTKEMALLIETALDIAHEVGIETSYYDEVLR